MIGEGQKSFLRYGVDCVWRGKSGDVENVRRLWVFGAGTRKQEPLRSRAKVGQSLPAIRGQDIAVYLVGLLTDGDAEFVPQLVGHFVHRSAVPSTQEDRGDRMNIGTETR